MNNIDYFFVFIGAIFLNLVIRKIFIRNRLVDKINHRSSHKSIATRSGGAVIFSIFIIYSLLLYLDGYQPYDFSFLIPLTILFVLGFYDDIKGVDFGLKFIFQIIAAKLLVDIGYVIDIFSIFGYEFAFSRVVSQLISIFIYVSIFNAYNFIDGIDMNIHLESIKNFILLLLLFDYSESIYKLIIFSLLIIIVNSYFNLNKRIKVFTGDSGSLIIPIIILFFIFEGIKLNDDQNIIKYVWIIFVYPLFDLIRVSLIRIKNKKSPFRADKNHIHHKTLNLLNSHIKSSLVIFCFVLITQLALIRFIINN